METTKNQQVTGLVLGIISVFLPNISTVITNAVGDDEKALLGAGISTIVICLIALIVGIIGIVKSAGARKAATAAGEKKVVATIGLVASIVGTVYGAILFFSLGLCVTCVLCAAAAAMA